MIPKIIHFCWFGRGPYPKLVEKCIQSWKTHLPDYEIMLWNEDNFNIEQYPFAKEALACKKYAFVADVCRLVALKEIGGVYLDTDVELLSSLDNFMHYNAFSGFEDNNCVTTGLMASVKDGAWVSDMLKYYENRSFIKENGEYDTTTNVQIITPLMNKKGLVLNNTYQNISDYIAYYPSDYFCPKSHLDGRIKITTNTIAIHHFAGSWLSGKERTMIKIKSVVRNIIGNDNFEKIKQIVKK